MDPQTKKVLAAVINLFFPGLGNIWLGQVKFGLPVLFISMILTVFYFIPLLSVIFPSDQILAFLVITSMMACASWLVDVILMILSIWKIFR